LADWRAIFSVWAALSAFCLMLEAISSIEAEASSADEACSVAPWLTCSEAADSSWLPAETFSEAEIASETTPRRRSIMTFTWPSRSPISSLVVISTVLVRSPSATARTASEARVRPLLTAIEM
jgi:hypothetical protein